MFKGFCAEVFYHASPYRLLWGISIFDAKITLRLYTEKNQPRYLTNQGQFIQEWTGGYSLLQGNLARNLFPIHYPQSHYNTMSSCIFFDIKEWEKYGWRSNNISIHSLQVSLAHTQNGLWGLGPMQGKSFFSLRIHMKRIWKHLQVAAK